MDARCAPRFILFIFVNIFIESCHGKGSLTYVIDNTLSMTKLIDNVKSSTDSITKAVFEEKGSQIENMVLVTFNDPFAHLKTVTTDRNIFKSKIDAVYVHNRYGNWDCPEMSMTGLSLALENSLPGSFVYVFTDSAAKDFNKKDDIIRMCQEKQTQVVMNLIYNPGCKMFPWKPNYLVYHEVAAACAGIVLDIGLKEIPMIFKPIKDEITDKKAVIMSRKIPAHKYIDIPFFINNQTNYAKVTVTSQTVVLTIRGPPGYHEWTTDKILWLKNVKIVRLNNLVPGTYIVNVGGKAPTTVSVVGKSSFSFEYGFSKKKAVSLKDTSAQPIAKALTRLFISTNDSQHGLHMISAQILDMNEREITKYQLPLTRVNEDFYETPIFVAPTHVFKVAVFGKDRDTDKDVRHIARFPVTPQIAKTPPKITSDSSVTYKVDEGSDKILKIPCTATGEPKPTITWTVGLKTISSNEKYSIINGVLMIRDPIASDAGTYVCEAKNVAGSVRTSFKVEVRHAPMITGEARMTVTAGTSCSIKCTVTRGVPAPIISWKFMAKGKSIYRPLAGNNAIMDISSIDETHAGYYKCIAHNAMGDSEHVTNLIVQVLPSITSDSSIVYKSVEGKDDMLKIPCTASGMPKPTITWRVGHTTISPNNMYSIKDGTLIIKNPMVSDSGSYVCEARNNAGSSQAAFQANVLQAPVITGETSKTVIVGATATIQCTITKGVPAPKVKWQFTDASNTKFIHLENSNNVLSISNVKEDNAGRYKCIAENIVGEYEHTTVLIVQIPPSITSEATVYKAIEGKDTMLNIPCTTTGQPKPTITWTSGNEHISTNDKYFIEDEALVIRNPTVRDARTYTCEAKNEAGSVRKSYTAEILQTPAISGESSVTVSAGTDSTIKCTITKGVPAPKITWQFLPQGKSQFRPIPGDDNFLHLSIVDVKHSGYYKCVVHNIVGDDEHVTALTVNDQPSIISSNSAVYSRIEGKDKVLKIPCITTGFPKPDITWTTQYGNLITPNDKYAIENGTLIIKEPTVNDTQTYVCDAKNIVGSHQASFKAEIHQTPMITGEAKVTVTAGKPCSIKCTVTRGVPAPIISWKFMAKGESIFKPLAGNDIIMYISNIDETHAGHYKCIAHNEVGDSEHVTNLIVQVLPNITSDSSRVYNSIEGKDSMLRIPCTVSGLPKPTITWIMENSTISSNEKYTIKDGALIILNPSVSDTGTYVCEAQNNAGAIHASFQAEILQVPVITGDASITAITGTTATMQCTIMKGIPAPKVKWQFMGANDTKFTPLEKYDNILQISNVKEENAGRYKCVAENIVGEHEHITDLIVQVPPSITSNSSTIYKAIEGKDMTLKILCTTTAFPKPTITWTIGNVTISTSEKYSIKDEALEIHNPTVSDTGTYTCGARNKAGATHASFQIEILQAPVITGETSMTVTAGTTATIQCTITKGIPAPKVKWQFMGANDTKFTPLEKYDNILKISKVKEENAGRYKCVAKNIVGEHEHITDLIVQVPPSITSDSSTIYKAIEGKDTTLKILCTTTAFPKPTITWTVGNLTISTSEKYSIKDEALVIRNPTVSDTGTYTCGARNKASATHASFQVEILQAPLITGETSVTVIAGTTANIQSTITKGIPAPKVKWQFMGANDTKFTPLEKYDNILQISNVKEENAGRYKCIAENIVGEHEHITNLIVQVPPSITSDSSTIYKAIEGKDTTLKILCTTTAFPKPTITWTVENATISTSEKYSIKDEALEIHNPTVSDTGTYTCGARNKAGATHASFQVEILQAPLITGETSMTIIAGTTATIQCTITKGVPTPKVKWQFMGASNTKFTSLQNFDNILHISNVKEENAGRYKCVAENIVGEHEHITDLVVQVPPSITSNSSTIYKAIEGKDTTLKILCTTTAFPKPTITWTVGNVTISINEKYSIKVEALVILNPTVSDTGTYVCGARNKAGATHASFQVEILQAPVITGDTSMTVIAGTTATIQCTITKGVPIPKVKWQFMGASDMKFTPLENFDNILHISNVKEENAGRYKCVAENIVGEHEHITILIVQVPPSITSDSSTTYKAIEGKDTMLKIPCVTTALPKSTITWILGNITISTNEKYSITDEALVILDPTVSDTGNYVCGAQNKAGASNASFQVEILQAPVITGDTSMTVIAGTTATIKCTITKGVPVPKVNWQFMGANDTKFSLLENYDNVKKISNVKQENAGRYKCVAENIVGQHERITDLIVQVPPSFTSDSSSVYKAIEGKDTTLKIICPASGLPKPTITWTVRNETISTNEKYVLEDGALIIRNPTVNDSQTYTCDAKNVAGTESKSYTPEILQKPSITGETSMTVRAGSSTAIKCLLLSGVPVPEITWQFMPERGSRFSTLLHTKYNVMPISFVSSSDAGRYKCVAHNVVGDSEHVTRLVVEFPPLIINGNMSTYEGVEGDVALKIPCETVGGPPPVISWSVNGTKITADARYLISDGALTIKDPKTSDSGSYKCEANNHLGSVYKIFEANVLENLPDLGTIEEVDINKLEHSTYKLSCGTPGQSVKWFIEKKDLGVPGNDFFLKGLEDSYTGNYTCRVSDMNGTYTKTYSLNIGSPTKFLFPYVKPNVDWTGNSKTMLDCSVETNANAEVEWTYNGKILSERVALRLKIIGWGHYTCNVSNVFGAIQRSFDVTSSKCLIPKTAEGQKNPLILSASSTWPKLSSTDEYFVVKAKHDIKLACPNYEVNNLKNFPKQHEITATCVKQDMFVANGKDYKWTDLSCEHKITPTVVKTNKKCLTDTSDLIRVGYDVSGFLETYQVCYDTFEKIPLYSRVHMSGNDNRFRKNGNQNSSTDDGAYTCETLTSKCCYGKDQLISTQDLSDGPSYYSAFVDSLNDIPVWRPCDEDKLPWDEIQNKIRSQQALYDVVVWSGIHGLQKMGRHVIPHYLWKIVEFDGKPLIAVAYMNGPLKKEYELGEKEGCNLCTDETVYWLQDLGNHVYCCYVKQFQEAFGLKLMKI